MTDNEIVKALDICSNHKGCCDCPLRDEPNDCYEEMRKPILDLINRQKAEIEMIQLKIEGVQEANAILREYIRKAVKEFAERFEKEAENVWIDSEGDFLYSDSDNTTFEIYNTVAEWCKEVAKNILKEMVGDVE